MATEQPALLLTYTLHEMGFFYIKTAVGEILFHLTVTVNEIQLTSSDSVDATFYSHV